MKSPSQITPRNSISIIMPALNEEANLEAAVKCTREVLNRYFLDWEICIFNDGSTDGTGALAEHLASQDSRLRVFHHARPHGLGGVYQKGIESATKEFVMMIPGDNENGSESLGDIFALAGEADMVIPYVVNPQVRPWKRRTLSRAFVRIVNFVTGLRIRYFNGTVLHRTEVIRSLKLRTSGFGYSAEAIVRLIKRGCSYREVGISLAGRPQGRSKALHLSNVIRVTKFLGGLIFSPPEKPIQSPNNPKISHRRRTA